MIDHIPIHDRRIATQRKALEERVGEENVIECLVCTYFSDDASQFKVLKGETHTEIFCRKCFKEFNEEKVVV